MTSRERDFILKQGLPDELFIDALGESINKIEEQMKASGKVFAYNSIPCQHNHTLRTRAGHCIQCDTARIAFILRHVSFGTVYIAGSKKGRLIKIGMTTSKDDRVKSLNHSKYGSQSDWEIIFSFKCLSAGALEFGAHKSLSPFAATGIGYNHDRHEQQTYELFRCSYGRAKDVLVKLIETMKIEPIHMKEHTRAIPLPDFPTLRRR